MAAKLGGELARDGKGQLVIRAPAPDHSKADRSLGVWLDEHDPEGFSVHGLAGEDWVSLKDYVRTACGLPAFKPNGKGNGKHKPQRNVVAEYVYTDLDGAPVLKVSRTAPKDFFQSRPAAGGWEPGGIADARRVPFRLPQITERGSLGVVVYVTEGEKAALKLWDHGLPATCSSGGAGKWRQHHARWFAGFRVIVLADNDEAGRKHAEQVRASLEPVADWVRVVNLPGLPDGGDVADWIDAGNDPRTIPELRSGPPQRGYSAAALWDMQFPPVSFAVPGYIAEGLTLLAGAPKRGKSWLALDVCCAVASGGYTLGDTKCSEGDVLYCALEDSPRRIKERLHRVRQLSDHAPRRLTVWFGADMPRLGDGCEEALTDWIGEQPQPRLIVVDTLNYIRPERTRDEEPYGYDYRSATALQRLCTAHSGLAVIIVHHTRKSPSDDYLESVSGTNGLTGGSDAVMVLERGSDGGFVLKGRGRDLEEFESALRFDRDECRFRALGDLAEARLSDTRQAILKVLRESGWFMSPQEIAQQTGRKPNGIHQQLFKMAKAGEVIRSARNKYGLPPEVIRGDLPNESDD
jgi:hypothetical protein